MCWVMEVGNLWLIPLSLLFNSGLFWLQKHYLVKWYCRRFLAESVVLECDLNNNRTNSNANGFGAGSNGHCSNGKGVNNSELKVPCKKKTVTDGDISAVSME